MATSPQPGPSESAGAAPSGIPGSNGPVLPDRASCERFADSTKYFETMIRGKDAPKGGRRRGEKAGTYAFLPSGSTITSASGAALGEGLVTLCSRSGAALTADGETGVQVYNAGGTVNGPVYIKLGWTDGDWSVDVVLC